ncbi:MAG: hypothetical protein RML45_15705 [Acetobacteraceae bacterium]|nr:hypothetical protein [Acetobacteraceae bacterium]
MLADREIGDQADPHARPPGRALGRRKPALGEPLQEEVERDLLGPFARETLHVRMGWIAERSRPASPVPLRGVGAETLGVQRLENGVAAKRLSPFACEGGELLGQGRAAAGRRQ